MLKPTTKDEYQKLEKIESTDAIVIETLISKEDKVKFGMQSDEKEKKINAVRFDAAISQGAVLSETTEKRFKELLDRISLHCI